MANLHRKVKDGYGWHGVVKRGDMEYLEFSILRLARGEDATLGSEGRETVVVLTTGGCSVWTDDAKKSKPMGRRNVFDDPPWSIYLPNARTAHVKAQRPTELIVATAPAKKRQLRIRVVGPRNVEQVRRGRANFKRTIRNLIVSTDATEHVVFGETINHAGNWSSYPPHKHDTYNPPKEYPLEEIYFYKLQPEQGFGFQRVYTEGRQLDETYVIENNHVVLLKRGYHPVVAAGGYKLYYFWIIAGRTPRLCFVDDPAHAWVKKVRW